MKFGCAAAPALIGALSLAACGGSGTTVTHAVHRTPATTPRPAAPTTLKPGEAYEVSAGGSSLSVTVTKVIDPLVDSGAACFPACAPSE